MFGKLKTVALVIKEIKNWPVFFLAHTGLWRPAMVVYTFRNGLKVEAPKANKDWWNAYYEIFFKQFYNPAGFAISNQDVVIDIGAHQGLFSLYAARQAKKVYAFEPVFENFSLLVGNVHVNNVQNMMPFNMAVAGHSGKQTIMVSQNSFAHSSFSKEGQAREVLAVSLEDIVKKNNLNQIDFLKIDCEGAEYDILFNCPKEVLAKVKKISMECHYLGEGKNTEAVQQFLEGRGFIISTQATADSSYSYLFAKK